MELDIQKLSDGKFHLIGPIVEKELADKNKAGFEDYGAAKREAGKYGYSSYYYNPIFKNLFNSFGV